MTARDVMAVNDTTPDYYFFVCRTGRCSEISSFEARQRESPKELAARTPEAVGMSR